MCFPELVSSCSTGFDVVLLLTVYTLMCSYVIAQFPEGQYAPVAMESAGIHIKSCAPELTLGPELFVTWQGQCPLSCIVLHGPFLLDPGWV